MEPTKEQIEEARKDPKKRVVENADGTTTILERLDG